MATLLGMTAREYRSLEGGITHAPPGTILPLALAGLRTRLSDRTRSAESRARKNDERSKSRASARRTKTPSRPSGRDSL